MATPPAASAGKSLRRSRPWSRAAITSVAVATPGITGTPSSRQRSTTRALKPGVTTNRAPASTACVDLLRPHDRAGADEESVSAAMRRIASRRPSVRNVTSATGSPPAASASASGSAVSSSLEHDDRDDPVRRAALSRRASLTGRAIRRRPGGRRRARSRPPGRRGRARRPRCPPPSPQRPAGIRSRIWRERDGVVLQRLRVVGLRCSRARPR